MIFSEALNLKNDSKMSDVDRNLFNFFAINFLSDQNEILRSWQRRKSHWKNAR